MSRTLRNPINTRDFNELQQTVWDLYQYIVPFSISVTADYTTTGKVGYEKVVVDSTSSTTVTLHSGAEDKQRVQVVRHSSSPVTVATEGSETINGASTITIGSQYDSPLFEWDDVLNEWGIN